jgi:hypothetical protein
MRVNFTALGLLVVASGTAAAGPFVNIDRQDETSRAGGEFTYLVIDDDSVVNDITLMRFDAHGQYIDAASGAGGYLTIPIAYGSNDGETETALGDVELGGIYNIATGTDVGIVLHGGLLLPTADDDFDSAIVGGLSGQLRAHDLYQWIPKGTTLRLAASPTIKSGKVFARLDVGVDLNIDNSSDDDADPGIHFNAGVGVWAGETVALTGELSTMTISDDNEGDDDSIANLAFGARFFAGSVAPYLGLIFPLDDDVSDNIDFGITVGLDAAL